jgi:hypothetical protein
MPEVAFSSRLYDERSRVYHSDLGCSHAPEDPLIRPLGSLDEARDWRECEQCIGDIERDGSDWSYQELARESDPADFFGGESA